MFYIYCVKVKKCNSFLSIFLLSDQVIMSVPPIRELNCSKSLGEIASLDFSAPTDCFAMYSLVCRYAGQTCHSSPTCRNTCLCMDRIHFSLQETMTLKPVNEVDAIIKFMLFLCQVSLWVGSCFMIHYELPLFNLSIVLIAT